MKEFSIYGLQNDELLFVALVAMPPKKLVQHILRIDEILPFDVLEPLMIQIDQLIEIIQELVLKVADVIWLFPCDIVVN